MCYFSSTSPLLETDVRVEGGDGEGYRCRAGLIRLRWPTGIPATDQYTEIEMGAEERERRREEN